MKKIFFFPILITVLVTAHLYAQKLPNIQEKSIWLPPNFKIDGKTDEWEDQLQAFNHATDVYYTIANDNENLYIVFKANDPDIVQKITQGGITFKIEQKGHSDFELTYPVLEKKESIVLRLRDSRNISKDSARKAAPLIMKSNNNLMTQKFKSIVVKGVKGTDTLSIYNEVGVKAACFIDVERIYRQELIIPFKLMGIDKHATTTINYRIQVNGSKYIGGLKISLNVRPGATPSQTAEADRIFNDVLVRQARLSTMTDLEGEYILAIGP